MKRLGPLVVLCLTVGCKQDVSKQDVPADGGRGWDGDVSSGANLASGGTPAGQDGAGGHTSALPGAGGATDGGTMGEGGATAPELAVFAGVPNGGGNKDGVGANARFGGPRGVAADGAGNLYVVDSGNNTIRKVMPDGTVSTLAGSGWKGSADGTGAAASFSFYSPTGAGVAVDGAGNVYVTDSGNNTIRKITPAGVVSTPFAAAHPCSGGIACRGTSVDGTGAAASFGVPSGIAVDGAGNLFVADAGTNTIRKITAAGVVSTLAGTAGSAGSADGTGPAARFNAPQGMAVDGAGNVYVADTGNSSIRKITPGGAVTTLATDAVYFNAPRGVAVDGAGNVYVADSGDSAICKIAPDGTVTTLAGTLGTEGSADGPAASAGFAAPQGVAVDAAGNLYVGDTANDTIRKITPNGMVITVAGALGNVQGSADGAGTAARFFDPQGVATDGAGNVYVADTYNDTIRKITQAGTVTTLAGAAGETGSADGTGAAARFYEPRGVAVDGAGNVLVADWVNATIRKITPVGVVSTFAGKAGTPGSADGLLASARFSGPMGLAVDGAGNVYVADNGNSTIRKITPEGTVSTLAGAAGVNGSADGSGAAARFTSPEGVAVDATGNVFVADTMNQTIRKITPEGVVTTLAGMAGSPGTTDGVGAAATFNWPQALAVDGAGNVYVADTRNNAVRKITPSGEVSTVVGVLRSAGIQPGPMPTPIVATSGNLPGPLPASIMFPTGLAIDASKGKLYIALQNGVMVAGLAK